MALKDASVAPSSNEQGLQAVGWGGLSQGQVSCSNEANEGEECFQ